MTQKDVSLVIPGRDCEKTLAQCLESVVPLLNGPRLKEIIFVDDGSVDSSAEIASRYSVTVLKGTGSGPGAARNLGWRACNTPFVWFIDSDCVAEDGALDILMNHLEDPTVAGVGGSYGNMRPDSLLSCLIHEEIVARHARMPDRVNFLATFNVVYRRKILEDLDGFNETFINAQDAEFSFRVHRAGHTLAFDIASRVKHHHPVALASYLRTQNRQGYWRALLYAHHPKMMKGDSYSGMSDHIQPVLTMLSIGMAPIILLGPLGMLQIPLLSALALSQVPMTARLVAQTGDPKFLSFAALSMIRAYARGAGLARGGAQGLLTRLRGRAK